MQILRRLAPAWLPRLLAVWLLASFAAVANACIDTSTQAVHEMQASPSYAHGDVHTHDELPCDAVADRSTITATLAPSGRQPIRQMQAVPAADPIRPRTALAPAPGPFESLTALRHLRPLYLRTARLRI